MNALSVVIPAGRTYAEGKKIIWRDGVRALWCIVKYSLRRQRG